MLVPFSYVVCFAYITRVNILFLCAVFSTDAGPVIPRKKILSGIAAERDHCRMLHLVQNSQLNRS
jgi:hypothetical protein